VGDLVRPGEKSERVLDVHRRLAAEDYDVGPAPEDSVLNESLGDAVAEFQRRHGLVIDRIIGPNTRAAMNVPASDRVRQIEVNLVRWHWMPVDLGGRHLFVNLPEYRLQAYDNGQEVLSMKVVVGADYDQRATPAFSDEVTYAQFKPYWNVPMSIARDELVPRGPEDLRKSGFEIVPEFGVSEDEVLPMTDENLEAVAEGQHFLRERPGPTNALGRVKYMFPNEFAIYLHDTPEDHLFEERERTFSHGCIRVEDPAALGAFLFQPRDWSEREIRRRMNEGPKNQRVDLRQPVPVFILYFTAFVDESGDVHFRPDVYGYDEPIREALAAREIREPDVSIEELTGLLP
ncbi:MAG: L,D-transpeptidase family protein, partial [Bacteroidota bacterium]